MKKIFRLFTLPVFATILFLCAGFLVFPSSGRDDSFITYWAVYSLGKWGHIINYNFQPVEQSSSMAHVILAGLFSALLHVNPVIIGRLTAILSGIGSIWAVDLISQKSKLPQVTLLLLAINPIFIYWSFGGLETSLGALGWILFIYFQSSFIMENRQIWPAIFACLLVLITRPENPIIITLFSIGALILSIFQYLFLEHKSNQLQRQVLRAVINLFINIAGIGLLFGLRLALFGDIFPQPVRAKTSGLSFIAFMQGFKYLSHTLTSLSMAGIAIAFITGSILLLFLFFWKKPHQPTLLHGLLLAGIYILFIAFSGGDWMEGGRFIVHILPLMTMLAMFAISKIQSKAVFRATISIILVLQLVGLAQFATKESTAIPAWEDMQISGINSKPYSWFEKHSATSLRDMPVIAALDTIIQKKLQKNPAPVVIMSGQMGMVSYYTAQKYGKQIIWLDRNSLIERSFTTCPISRQWERDDTGRLRFSYNTFLKQAPALTTECGIPTPDIIFDLNAYLGHVDGRGFEVVYMQEGYINAGLSSGNAIDAGEFIAVNQKHAELITDLGKTEFKINPP